jgi:hypothetical protein
MNALLIFGFFNFQRVSLLGLALVFRCDVKHSRTRGLEKWGRHPYFGLVAPSVITSGRARFSLGTDTGDTTVSRRAAFLGWSGR